MIRRHGLHPRDVVPPRSIFFDSGKFGRMFRELPPFAPDTPQLRSNLLEIGAPGGIMDAMDELARGPKDLILNPGPRNVDSDNSNMTAGMTFLGQFIDHDITLDLTSSLERQADPEQIANFRTPTLALDNLYGTGPQGSPHLYDRTVDDGLTKFLVEETGTPGKFDVPRNSQKIALIGDARNDENLILSQLHLAFLLFHNQVVDYVKATIPGLTEPELVFARAQEIVRWHYQWILVHEFLPITCGNTVVQKVLTEGRKFYKWRNEPFIPVEFSVAAYRFGHSQVRPSYRANFTAGPVADNNELFLFIFNPGVGDPNDPEDLSGSVRAPRRFIDWPTFFKFDNRVRRNKKIDTILSTPLFGLPGTIVPDPDLPENPRSLAQRNLVRHLTFSLPSGQRVARAMGIQPLETEDFSDLKKFGLENRTPLWFYILREADKRESGRRLGPVGARIVTEVFIGLLEGDKESYLTQEPDWKPFLPTIDPSRTGNDFKMVDLLRFAGVA